MYPLKFHNIYFEKVWGGRDLELFRDNLSNGNIGESWDVACHKNGVSIVSNGEFKGKSLAYLINKYPKKLLGNKINKEKFPLLIKLINSKKPISIQVHPDNEHAKRLEEDLGKTEVWYVIEAAKGASLILGAKSGVSKKDLTNAIKEGDVEKYLNKVEAKKGDVFFIQSGLIHAIGQGLILLEIQQNSDITYRLYDYNRGRELHIGKGLEVVDLKLNSNRRKGLKSSKDGYEKTYLCLCSEFSLELYEIFAKAKLKSDPERFHILTCVEGSGTINCDSKFEIIKQGDSVMIPASLGDYVLTGKMKILRSYVPCVEKVSDEVLSEIK